jgi:hypothetical protein
LQLVQWYCGGGGAAHAHITAQTGVTVIDFPIIIYNSTSMSSRRIARKTMTDSTWLRGEM